MLRRYEPEDQSNWTVGDIKADQLIKVVTKCLTLLDASSTLPSTTNPPIGVAARHRVGSQLANILKELGYAGDCGYNHFLYPSEKETRNILSWLVGKLPRAPLEENEQVKTETSPSVETAASELSATYLAGVFSSWKQEKTLYLLKNRSVHGLKGHQRLPLQTSPVELPWRARSRRSLFEGFPANSGKAISLLEALAVAKRGEVIVLPEEEFEERELDAVTEAVQHQHKLGAAGKAATGVESSFLAPQAAEAADDEFATIQPQAFSSQLPVVPLSLESPPAAVSAGVITETSGSSRMDAEVPPAAQSDSPTESEEQDLDVLQQQVDDTERRIAAMKAVLEHEYAELHHVQQGILETQSTGQEMHKQLARQKQLVAMLPQAQANIAKLEAICQTNAEKKAEMVQQMELARAPLVEEFTRLDAQKSNRKARCRQLVREMKTFRSEMLELTGVIHSKMESVRALERLQERQQSKRGQRDPDGEGPMTRNQYTSRIMDIIKQVHKQKQDITKILADIKGLQKQMNSSAEKLKRTEAVAEEKLYTAASTSKSSSSGKADAYVECYRKFAQVRELFEELIEVVADVGRKENAARDLQNWISQLEARDSSSHLDKVLADLESVRLENGTLQTQLRARSA